ncbi:MAG: RHE_PE00001 family protein [Rhodoblastus sp.]|uniref:RHE_PE00001 family protein n=1 Tax=Rhodoblastus sp. TaxID=1962975 RepID=UPI003F962942
MKAEEKITEMLDWGKVSAPLVQAEDALARLDERLRASPIREGWVSRTHFSDACASLWIEGGLAHLEDLVLHDAQMDARAPTAEIIRAGRVLGARRRILSMAPGWALSTDGLAALRGGAFLPEGEGMAEKPPESDEADGEGAWLDDGGSDPDDPLAAELAALDAALAGAARALERKPALDPDERDPLVYDLDWDENERMEQWRGAVGLTADLPPVLAAAMLAALWDDIEPLQHAPWLGRLLASALLRQRGKTRSHLLCVNSGARAVPRLRLKQADSNAKILFWLAAVLAAAEQGQKDHDRWLLARASRAGKLKGRRGNSHLPAALDLALAKPIVTAELLAQELKVSARAGQNLIAELGLRELTGRRRYRAWGIL